MPAHRSHVLWNDDYALNVDVQREACAAAIALAKQWLEQRRELTSTGILISKPYVIVDDDWIDGRGEDDNPATPPHVYICLAREEALFTPIIHRGDEHAATGVAIIDAHLSGTERVSRVVGEDGGCWVVEPVSE